jgi:hypothetical protein
VRDNLLLGLRHRPWRTPDSGAVPATGRERAIEEARGNRETANSILRPTGSTISKRVWRTVAALESRIVKVLRLVDLEEDV